ncbi:MAG: DeoR/GlpR family DNA-binding transcription regulator [Spirosomataceae bacterium]
MQKHERQRIILEHLQTDKRINFMELSQVLKVSYDSIRRDVIELEDKGLLKKVHGGAVANSYLSRLSGEPHRNQEFQVMYRKILPVIESSRVILLDGGTTNFYIAEQLPKNLAITIVTNNLPLAMVLNDHPKVEVILLGGTYFKRYQISMGWEAIRQLDQLTVDTYIMGVNGVSLSQGLTIRHYEESLLKQRMMAASKQTYCCAIDEKIGQSEAFQICKAEAIQGLVTNLKPTHERLAGWREAGLQLI